MQYRRARIRLMQSRYVCRCAWYVKVYIVRPGQVPARQERDGMPSLRKGLFLSRLWLYGSDAVRGRKVVRHRRPRKPSTVRQGCQGRVVRIYLCMALSICWVRGLRVVGSEGTGGGKRTCCVGLLRMPPIDNPHWCVCDAVQGSDWIRRAQGVP